MQKQYDNLTLLQKMRINRWFNRNFNHYATLERIGVVDLISLPTNELLMSFFKTEHGCETALKVLDKHKTDYIVYNNVIFRL